MNEDVIDIIKRSIESIIDKKEVDGQNGNDRYLVWSLKMKVLEIKKIVKYCEFWEELIAGYKYKDRYSSQI